MFNTLEDVFTQYDKTIDLVKNHPIKGPIQYHFTGVDVCDWYIEINDVDIVAHKGTINNPASVVECDSATYIAIKNGTVSHNEALTTNKMKLVAGIRNVLGLSTYMIK